MAVEARPVYRVALLISIGKETIGERELKKIRELAEAVRCSRGVRQVDAVIWRRWDAFPRIEEPIVMRASAKRPWRPSGVWVWIESYDEKSLQRKIAAIWETARKVLKGDPELMEFNGTDIW